MKTFYPLRLVGLTKVFIFSLMPKLWHGKRSRISSAYGTFISLFFSVNSTPLAPLLRYCHKLNMKFLLISLTCVVALPMGTSVHMSCECKHECDARTTYSFICNSHYERIPEAMHFSFFRLFFLFLDELYLMKLLRFNSFTRNPTAFRLSYFRPFHLNNVSTNQLLFLDLHWI